MFRAQDFDLIHTLPATTGVQTINSATTTNIGTCDLTDAEQAIAVLVFGTVTTIATISSLKIQQSDDNSTFTDVFDFIAGASGQTAWTPADTDDGKYLSCSIDMTSGQHKYWRWQFVTTGTPNFQVAMAGFGVILNRFVPPTRTNSKRLGAGLYTAIA